MISFSVLITFLQDYSSELQGEVTGQSLLGMKKLRTPGCFRCSVFAKASYFKYLV